MVLCTTSVGMTNLQIAGCVAVLARAEQELSNAVEGDWNSRGTVKRSGMAEKS